MTGVLARGLVTGSQGQLGAAFVNHFTRKTQVAGVDIGALDLTVPSRVRTFVRESRPTLVLNCAAFNDVDGAETQVLAA